MTEPPAPFPDIFVRDAREADMAQVAAIYAPYVLNGIATFEEVPPTAADMVARRADVSAAGFPYLVAETGGRIAGYCYANSFRQRPAYRFTIEDSIYVAEELRGRGIGKALIGALIARCEKGPWRQMIAVIGGSDNAASIALHRRMGFKPVGTLVAVGFKFGRWIDTVQMQRALGGDRG